MKVIALLQIVYLIICGTLEARIINIPGDYPTIQEGIGNAGEGDTVLVSRGIYQENVNFRGKGIILTSHFIFSRDSLDISNTIIDGVSPIHPDTASCVSFLSGEGSDSRLCGFTLRNGLGTYYPDSYGRRYGGGVLIDDSSPLIENNIIVDNAGYALPDGGGGIALLNYSEPVIRNNIISGNYALAAGGGILAIQSGGRIEGNTIDSNETFTFGGGMALFASNPIVEENVIIHNSCGDGFDRGWGAGMYVELCDFMEIRNNTFYDNHQRYYQGGEGGGLYLYNSFSVIVENNIFTQNELGGIRAYGTAILLYNDFWSNIPVDYVGIEPGEFDISQDPLFVNELNDDFHLSGASPCIDAGNPDTPIIPWGGFRRDMGAFEYDQGFYFDGQNIILKPFPIHLPRLE